MSFPATRLTDAGATSIELTALQLNYTTLLSDAGRTQFDSVFAGVSRNDIMRMLQAYRLGYPFAGLPYVGGFARLTGLAADDTNAVAAGTGIEIPAGGGAGGVTKTPASAGINTIQPTGDFEAIDIQAHTGQTQPLLRFLNSAGSRVMTLVDADGRITLDNFGGLVIKDGSGNQVAHFAASSGFQVATSGAYAWTNLGTDGPGAGILDLLDSGGNVKIRFDGNGFSNFDRVGFNGTAAIAKPTVTGSKGGNVALASLLTALASYGLITDSST